MTQSGVIRGGLRTNPPRTNGRNRAAPEETIGRRYVRHIAFDLRLWEYFSGWLIVPSDQDPHNLRWYRWRRFKFKLRASWPNFRRFVAAVFGPRVPAAEFETREAACAVCPYIRIRLPRREGGRARRFCASCGCPDWPLAKLSVKNRLERWRCPAGRHPAREDWVEDWIRKRESSLARTSSDADNRDDLDR